MLPWDFFSGSKAGADYSKSLIQITVEPSRLVYRGAEQACLRRSRGTVAGTRHHPLVPLPLGTFDDLIVAPSWQLFFYISARFSWTLESRESGRVVSQLSLVPTSFHANIQHNANFMGGCRSTRLQSLIPIPALPAAGSLAAMQHCVYSPIHCLPLATSLPCHNDLNRESHHLSDTQVALA